MASEAGQDQLQGRKRNVAEPGDRDQGLSCLLRKGTPGASLLLWEGKWRTDRARVETNNHGKICSLLPQAAFNWWSSSCFYLCII